MSNYFLKTPSIYGAEFLHSIEEIFFKPFCSHSDSPVSSKQARLTKVRSIRRVGCPKKSNIPWILVAVVTVVILVIIGAVVFYKRRGQSQKGRDKKLANIEYSNIPNGNNGSEKSDLHDNKPIYLC